MAFKDWKPIAVLWIPKAFPLSSTPDKLLAASLPTTVVVVSSFNALPMAIPFTFNLSATKSLPLKDESDCTEIPELKDISPPNSTEPWILNPAFNETSPFTYKLEFNDRSPPKIAVSFTNNPPLSETSSFTYKLEFNDRSPPKIAVSFTNNPPLNETSSPTVSTPLSDKSSVTIRS